MRPIALATALSAASTLITGSLIAGPDQSTLVIEGEVIVTDLPAPAGSPVAHLYSGWRFRNSETQALQMDDFENPAFTAVDFGEELWNTPDGGLGKSCASCHGDASESMLGVRAEMPKWSDSLGKPHTMETQINACRNDHMAAQAWKWEASEMLAMTAYLGLQSRGVPVSVKTDGGMASWIEQGRDLYYTRVGQLDMACANCHEANFGKMIRADHLSQGHINGFPVYRLKWGGLGSIHRRFKGCMSNIRATPYKRGSDEFIALEAYIASRGNGLGVETPSVRN
ncbi:MAG: sulfur oxidation c-type cytochrome SoxA [Pseudomonadota bacterium]